MLIDKTQPILVTGASGYVAGQLIKRLLAEGLSVHATVRQLDDREVFNILNQLADDSDGTITYFEADLLDNGSYAEAMAGCQIVFHVASPFNLTSTAPQQELIEPAVKGTRNVLTTVSQTPSVKRVVLTSSCAAIYSDNADLDDTPNGVFTESCWNHKSSLTHQPYAYSKTQAERLAWELYEQQNDPLHTWELISINPSLIIGPGITVHNHAESFKIVRRIGSGDMHQCTARYGLGVVDVRDVAEAHYRAAFMPTAKGRYISSAHNTDFTKLIQTLEQNYGKHYPLSYKILPKILIWLIGPLIDKKLTRKIVLLNVNKPWRADNSKIKKDLGMTFRPLETSINEMFQQLIDSGQLVAKSKARKK